MSFSMVTCVADDMCIGAGNKLLAHVKPDMKRFAEITKGNTVVMGRHTYESLPSMKPLKGRENIIVSKTMNIAPEGFSLCSNIYTYMDEMRYSDKDIYIIGGAKIYKEFLPVTNTIYMTWLHADPSKLYMSNNCININDIFVCFPYELYDYNWHIEVTYSGTCLQKNYGLLKYDFLTLRKSCIKAKAI